jgi:hypothetical protein
VGTHQQARIAHEKKIATIKGELEPVEAAISKEQAAEVETDKEISTLALEAARGNRVALKKQHELRTRKAEHNLQSSNIEAIAVPIRRALAAAEAELPHFIRAEVIERVANGIRELPAMVDELSKVIQPIAKALGEFNRRFDAATGEALPIIAGGDSERISTFTNRLRTAVVRGIRAQLSFEFRSEGLNILSVSEFEGKNFQCVVEPLLSSMISALEMNLHTNGAEASGNAEFRAKTNISGLFGVNLRVGEIVSLPLEHKDVKMHLSHGALEMVDALEKTEEGA